MTKTIVKFVAGDQVERPTGKGTAQSPLSYRWVAGFHRLSASGAKLHPAMTRSEARAEAQREGAKAVFVEA